MKMMFKHANQTFPETVSTKVTSNANVVALPVVRTVKNIGKANAVVCADPRVANHNLTRAALRSNVVVLSHFQPTDDFPPNMGARPALAA